MSDLNLNELRKVAEAATPGPWEVADEGYDERYVYDSASGQMCWTPDLPGHWSLADATHIATFDPPTVLALLDRVAELEAKVARVESLRQAAEVVVLDAGDEATGPEPDPNLAELAHCVAALDAEALREARSPALPHTRTLSGGAVMTIHNVRLFWSGYVLTVLNSIVLGACLERMLR